MAQADTEEVEKDAFIDGCMRLKGVCMYIMIIIIVIIGMSSIIMITRITYMYIYAILSYMIFDCIVLLYITL